MKKQIFIVLIYSLLFLSCSSKVQKETNLPDKSTSRNSLDWAGTYKGILPCADCEGIETTLIISSNYVFQITKKYLGKKSEPIEKYGVFEWNKEGNTITLIDIDSPNKFFVRENSVVQLDIDGNFISGELAEKYILEKVSREPITKITDVTWRLVEIQGKPLSRKQNDKKPIQFKLNSAENRVNGFAGCNSFWGSYTLQDGNRITFSKMASTLMACTDLHIETELYRVFDRADSYTIKDNFLFLNKARMAPLAKFEAVLE
jgi:heat shock protein HslJ